MNEEQANAELKKNEKKFKSEQDIKATVEQDGGAAKRKGLKGALRQYWQDICDAVDMLYDVTTLRYPGRIPFMTLAALAGAVAYIACPFDFVPDIFPVLGLTDDAAVFAIAMRMARKDLSAYRAWRSAQVKFSCQTDS